MTRSTQRAQTSLAEADHYSCIVYEGMWSWQAATIMLLCIALPWWKVNPKGSESLPRYYHVITTIWSCYSYYSIFCSFTHLKRPRSPPKFNQFFIVGYHGHPTPICSTQFHHNPFKAFWITLFTSKQTNRQTDATENITSFCQGGITIYAQSKGEQTVSPLPRQLYICLLKYHECTMIYILNYKCTFLHMTGP